MGTAFSSIEFEFFAILSLHSDLLGAPLEAERLATRVAKPMRIECTRRIELCVKLHEKPIVTHGMVLRETYLELLMGPFYVRTATTYSWYGFT